MLPEILEFHLKYRPLQCSLHICQYKEWAHLHIKMGGPDWQAGGAARAQEGVLVRDDPDADGRAGGPGEVRADSDDVVDADILAGAPSDKQVIPGST